jgi:hypothetical protein
LVSVRRRDELLDNFDDASRGNRVGMLAREDHELSNSARRSVI